MKGTRLILAAVAVIATTRDFRSEGLPRPQENVDLAPFMMVDGFAFDGPAKRAITFTSTPRASTIPSTTVPPNVAKCIQNCRFRVTPEYNPVCGIDLITYWNPATLKCAKNCGHDVELLFNARCEPATIS